MGAPPDNRTGMLMTIVGLVTAVSGLQLFDEPVPYVLGSLADTTTAALLVHLLLAFPSGRLEGRAARGSSRSATSLRPSNCRSCSSPIARTTAARRTCCW